VKVAPDTSKLCSARCRAWSFGERPRRQDVKAGEALAVVEAMKMENVLTAQADGTVKKVNATKGDSLALDRCDLEFA